MRELTQDQVLQVSQGICPFCKSDDWLEGPHGGAAINVYCNVCHAGYNIIWPFDPDLIYEPADELPISNVRPMTPLLHLEVFVKLKPSPIKKIRRWRPWRSRHG